MVRCVSRDANTTNPRQGREQGVLVIFLLSCYKHLINGARGVSGGVAASNEVTASGHVTETAERGALRSSFIVLFIFCFVKVALISTRKQF